MTVSTSYAPLSFSGNGATTAFAVTWPFFDSSLVVTLVDSTGVETVQTITTHYTVSGGTDSDGLPATGTVTMLTAPASGETLRITRSTSKVQSSSWTNGGAYQAKTLEAALDKIILIAQENAAATSDALDGITGDVLRYNSAGATNFWDAESELIRNLADGSDDSDAVNYGQLAAAVLASGNWLGTLGSTDNTVPRSSGTGGTTMQASGVTIDDNDVMAGVRSLSTDVGGGLWPDTETAYISKVDRLFVGDAANDGTGNRTGSQGTIVPTATEGANWAVRDSSLMVVAPTGLMAVTGMSRASDQTDTPTATIGSSGFVINDGTGTAWGLYSDLQHESGANLTLGLEVAAKNKGANSDPTPYSVTSGVYGVWLAGGGDGTYGGAPANPSQAAMVVLANDHTWNKGIIFKENSLTSATSVALGMPHNYQLAWYLDSSNFGARIRSETDTAGQDTTLVFDNNVTQLIGGNSARYFEAEQVSSGANFVNVKGAIATASPTISAKGSDTNINLTLSGKGTGGVVATMTNTGLHILDTDASHDLIIAPGSNLTADRTLTVTTGDSDRTLDISASNVTVSSAAATVLDDTSVRAMCATLGTWYVLGQSSVASSHTGNTSETQLASVTIPAGAMGANGRVRVTTIWTMTNNANNKTLRVRLGGSGGTVFLGNAVASQATYVDQREIGNRNSQSSQIGKSASAPVGGFGNTTLSVVTASVDTSSAQDIYISGQLADGADTVTLESYCVELFYGA